MSINNGADLHLHCHPHSFYSQKVLMALYQKKLKFRPIIVNLDRGRQFDNKFLALNPRGEVPVLVDDIRIIPDSKKIIDYLEDNFSNGGSHPLRPSDPELRQRTDYLHDTIHNLKVDTLTFGTAIYDDLELNPKHPYDSVSVRSQMKGLMEHRCAIIREEMMNHPDYADALSKKLSEIRRDNALLEDRKEFENLIIEFEKVMDDCEAELYSHEDKSWWLCTPNVSIADISFGILLNRLWELGLERRMWERNRPNISRYFARLQQLDSFKNAISLTDGSGLKDVVSSPLFWGFLGVIAIAGGGLYLWNKSQGATKGLMELFGYSDPSGSDVIPKRGAAVGPGNGFTRNGGSTSYGFKGSPIR